MAVQALLGIPAAAAAMGISIPIMNEIVKEHGPGIIDRFITADPDVNKPKVLDTPVITEEERKILEGSGYTNPITSINDMIEGYVSEIFKSKEKGLEQEKMPDMSIMTMAKGEKTLTPKEKEILDEFFEGPKEIIDSKKAKAKLGKNVDKRTGFDEHHLSYLADKFGLKKSDKELYGEMFTKGGNEVRPGWKRLQLSI